MQNAFRILHRYVRLTIFLIPAQAANYHDKDNNPPPAVKTAAAVAIVAVAKLESHGLTSLPPSYAGRRESVHYILLSSASAASNSISSISRTNS
jgi:hypothetical protein